MRKKTTKGRCEKRTLEKCIGVCKTYSPIQKVYAVYIEENDHVKEFRTNVLLDGEASGYTTDFVIETSDGRLMIRECISKSMLIRVTHCELLEISRKYWLSKGVTDWGIVIDGDK